MVTDTKSFVEKASKIHNNKYNYSKSTYTKSNENIIIICPTHGEFQQTANTHLHSKGCRKCGYETISQKNTTTTKWKKLIG